MNSLEEYLKLSNKDKQYLEHYVVYRDIYDRSKLYNRPISNEDIVDLREIILDLYQSNPELNYNDLIYFVADNVLLGTITLDDLKRCDGYDILCAMENGSVKDLLETEMER